MKIYVLIFILFLKSCMDGSSESQSVSISSNNTIFEQGEVQFHSMNLIISKANIAYFVKFFERNADSSYSETNFKNTCMTKKEYEILFDYVNTGNVESYKKLTSCVQLYVAILDNQKVQAKFVYDSETRVGKPTSSIVLYVKFENKDVIIGKYHTTTIRNYDQAIFESFYSMQDNERSAYLSNLSSSFELQKLILSIYRSRDLEAEKNKATESFMSKAFSDYLKFDVVKKDDLSPFFQEKAKKEVNYYAETFDKTLEMKYKFIEDFGIEERYDVLKSELSKVNPTNDDIQIIPSLYLCSFDTISLESTNHICTINNIIKPSESIGIIDLKFNKPLFSQIYQTEDDFFKSNDRIKSYSKYVILNSNNYDIAFKIWNFMFEPTIENLNKTIWYNPTSSVISLENEPESIKNYSFPVRNYLEQKQIRKKLSENEKASKTLNQNFLQQNEFSKTTLINNSDCHIFDDLTFNCTSFASCSKQGKIEVLITDYIENLKSSIKSVGVQTVGLQEHFNYIMPLYFHQFLELKEKSGKGFDVKTIFSQENALSTFYRHILQYNTYFLYVCTDKTVSKNHNVKSNYDSSISRTKNIFTCPVGFLPAFSINPTQQIGCVSYFQSCETKHKGKFFNIDSINIAESDKELIKTTFSDGYEGKEKIACIAGIADKTNGLSAIDVKNKSNFFDSRMVGMEYPE